MKKNLRISSCFNLHAPSYDNPDKHIRDGMLLMKKAGFDAIELRQNVFPLIQDEADRYVEKILQYSDEIGIRFENAHLPLRPSIPNSVESLIEDTCRAIDICKKLNIKYGVAHPANTLPHTIEDYDPKKDYDNVMAMMTPIVDYANKVGFSVVVENMQEPGAIKRYCSSPDELCEIADALGVGICWDFGHANVTGLKQSEALTYIGKRLKYLHLNDNYGYYDAHLPPFHGGIDWVDAMKGLAATGFDDLFNLELGTDRLPAEIRESYAYFLVDVAHKLQSLME